MSILSLNNVSKAFGDNKIIENASFVFEKGKIYGFIGPNGSGKTTTIRMILGLLQMDSGTITVHDEPVKYGETKTNRHIGYLPDVPEYYHYMNAHEYLTLCAKITEVPQSEIETKVTELIAEVGLVNDKKRISKYSRGMKQRLGIAQALIHNPDILICDEPTSALDPKGRQEILSILEKIKRRTTVIFSTHILSDVNRICDEVIVLTQKKIVDLNTLKLNNTTNHLTIKLQVTLDEKEKLQQQNEVARVGAHILIKLNNKDLKAFYDFLHLQKIYPSYIEVIDNSLENIYMEVTS
ncbi:ABC transporter ATP-binding protein [Macrococcus animalis]|uniref:ABC transporter ATP-binding protein n=1 Tax=Macrococcus animalis TaxID=3395467 RepID=UPI0039BEA31C